VKLAQRIEAVRNVIVNVQSRKVEQRKQRHDRGTKLRECEVGEMVLEWIASMRNKLEEAWRGPSRILERLREVNYRVVNEKGRHEE